MAKKEQFIIDGYNVINAWPELIALRDNLDFARDKLVDIMAEYGAYQHYDMIIVFDALFTAQGESCHQINKNLAVIFTAEGETADSCIEKLAYHLVREGREVHVVTSDWAEQTMILGAGAYRMSSRELHKSVQKTKKKIEEEYTHNAKSSFRRELGGRIQYDIAKKMDELRKRK